MNKRTKATLLVILGVVVSMGLISYQFKEHPDPEKSDQQSSEKAEATGSTANASSFTLAKADLELLTVNNTDKSIKWPISGRVVPKNSTQLFSEVQGKILNQGFMLKEGTSFRAGEPLVHLDSKEFELQLESQRSAFLNLLTGMMPDLKADYPDNYKQWLAYVQQYKNGQPLAALPATQSDGERYYVTSNQVYSTYYNIKALEERLSKFTILAPYSGLVTEAMADKGTLVSPGQLVGTIINNRDFELEAAAGLEVASRLRIGDRITFTSNEIGGQWVGTVLRINDIVDPKTQNIPIYFAISGAHLRAGMYLEGSFAGEAYPNVFALPSSVLTRDTKVLLLEDNTIKSREIELVEFMQDTILVRGLSNRDMVIANQFSVPVEGLKLSM